MFLVASDLSEAQRETYKFLFSWGSEYHYLYLWSSEDNISGIVLYAEKLGGKILHFSWADTSAAWTEPSS